jgi:DNA-binding LacI/PurR family transcriptional regulator
MSIKVSQVAKDLSLSPGTVSRVLNGKYGNSPSSLSTTHKILDHCCQRGYLSKSEKDKIIMKIIPRVENLRIFCLTCWHGLWAYTPIMAGISDKLQESGMYARYYRLQDETSLNQFPFEKASVVIIVGRMRPNVKKAFANTKTPLVLVDNELGNFKSSTVNSDNMAANARSVRILADKGHKRIAFMCRHEDDPEYTYNLHQRQAGYMLGMYECGLSTEGLIVSSNAPNDYGPERQDKVHAELEELADRVLDLNPRPTAVIAANDLTAHVLRQTAIKRGLRVPQNLSIIGYDGQHRIPGINSFFEPVSTMVVDWHEMGIAAVELAMRHFSDPQMPRRNVVIPTTYEDAGTVADVST